MSLLERAKRACRCEGTTLHDEDLGSLITAAKIDLGVAGVELGENPDELLQLAILVYCRMHFGREDGDVVDRLQRSYDAIKGQLQSATGYTDWGEGGA